jgi:hypothetical protein
MITDSMAVRMVTMAYSGALQRKGKKVRVPDLKPGGPLHKNCVDFFLLAEEAAVPVSELMFSIVDSFPENWCQKVFKRSYVPLSVATSAKQRNRALKNLPPEIRTGNLNSQIEMIFNQLSKLDRETAIDFIKAGVFSGGNEKLQKALLERMGGK